VNNLFLAKTKFGARLFCFDLQICPHATRELVSAVAIQPNMRALAHAQHNGVCLLFADRCAGQVSSPPWVHAMQHAQQGCRLA
jgi:hypothetical protein